MGILACILQIWWHFICHGQTHFWRLVCPCSWCSTSHYFLGQAPYYLNCPIPPPSLSCSQSDHTAAISSTTVAVQTLGATDKDKNGMDIDEDNDFPDTITTLSQPTSLVTTSTSQIQPPSHGYSARPGVYHQLTSPNQIVIRPRDREDEWDHASPHDWKWYFLCHWLSSGDYNHFFFSYPSCCSSGLSPSSPYQLNYSVEQWGLFLFYCYCWMSFFSEEKNQLKAQMYKYSGPEFVNIYCMNFARQVLMWMKCSRTLPD